MVSIKTTVNLPMAAVKILKGDPVIFSSGYATSAGVGSGDWCFGHAATTVDNSAGSAGDLYIGVSVTGIIKLPLYVGIVGAAGLYSSTIAVGDQLCVATIGGVYYAAKNAWAAATSRVIGYNIGVPNAGSTSGATVVTSAVLVMMPKVLGTGA